MNDFFASLVVFLVALPLCLGIAIASGVPPMLGLISGIVGGIVVGMLAGCPLQVTGPAAGLTVMVYEFVNQFGVPALLPLGLFIGAFQVASGYFKLGPYFQATTPGLIKGLLSGIGFLIMAGQLHIFMNATPYKSGPLNIWHLPESFMNAVSSPGAGQIALGLGLSSMALMLLWPKIGGKWSKLVPGALLGVVVASVLAALVEHQAKMVTLPSNVWEAFSFGDFSILALFSDPKFVLSAFAIALVATIESMLCVGAADKIASGQSSDYDKELVAQGVGNAISGLFGALPMTGVIVRTSANVDAGAKSRFSAVFHGVWLLVFVLIFPHVLELIPLSALAAILILSGWKLLDLKGVIKMLKSDRQEGAIFVITFGTIISVDLLTGVMAGLAAALLIVMRKLSPLQIDEERKDDLEEVMLKLKGQGTFLQVPKISKVLQRHKLKIRKMTVTMSELHYVDRSFKEHLQDWRINMESKGVTVVFRE